MALSHILLVVEELGKGIEYNLAKTKNSLFSFKSQELASLNTESKGSSVLSTMQIYISFRE